MVALIDAQRKQLLALDQRSGEVVWRQQFESQLFRPKVFENSLLVCELDGKVWKLSRETGEVLAGVQLPQKVSAPLGILAWPGSRGTDSLVGRTATPQNVTLAAGILPFLEVNDYGQGE